MRISFLRSTLAAFLALGMVLSLQAGASQPQRWWEGWSMSDQRLSQPRYGVVVDPLLYIRMSDGVVLEARVLRPRVSPGTRVPAILHISPYFSAGMAAASIAPELQEHRYVQRGYALVGITLRGFGGSGGCADLHSPRDRQDIEQVLNTVARQPWSSGRLGAIGASADGASANLAAVTGNPYLRTVVPVVSTVDLWLWNYMQGVPAWYNGYSANLYTGPLLTATQSLRGQPDPSAVAGRVCQGSVDAANAQREAALHGIRTPWWDQRDLRPLAARTRTDLAVLQVAGATDENVRADQLNEWDRSLGRRLANYRLVYGDWGHAWPDMPDQVLLPTNPEHHVNRHPLRSWDVLLLRWFDRWLKGRPTAIERMPRALTQDVSGTWHAEQALQPTSRRRLRLHPAPGGALATRGTAGSASWIDNGDNIDPSDSCVYPLMVVRACAPLASPNALFFVSAPVTTPIRTVGYPEASVTVATSAPSGTVGVTLYDVDGSTWTPITYGIASMGVRKDPHTFTPMSPGVPATVRVRLLARDWTLARGDRLGVGIGSQVGRNPRAIAGGGFQPLPSSAVNLITLGRGTFVDVWQATGTTSVGLR